MMREGGVLAVVRPDLAAGFALSGVEARPARDPQSALELLREAVASREWGIVIVGEDLAEGWDERERQGFAESTIPLVFFLSVQMKWVEAEKAPDEDFVARLIRRAVGYQLNIQA